MKMQVIILLCLTGGLALADSSNYEFPSDFLFGAASAAYQVEGGWDEDGKGESIWDTGIHDHPELVLDHTNGDIACDSYHKYEEDIQLLKKLGVDFYRFSISWARILPTGKADQINQPGIDYYNNLIDELLANSIEPYVTMYHFDLPQALQEDGGWLNRDTADYFADYARVLFENFGDRVKHWMTMNEIMSFCEYGYGSGVLAPFYSNPGIGDYECSHTALLAHGKVFRLYDEEFRAMQNGQIGIVVDTFWYEPNNPDKEEDVEASEFAMQMNYGWFVNPIVFGNYPDVMIERIANNSRLEGRNQSRLPEFTAEEQVMMKGTLDFLGLNHYSSYMVYFSTSSGGDVSHSNDVGVITYSNASWAGSASDWLKVVPWGLNRILNWIKDHYNNPPVLVTENGYPDKGELEDRNRTDYYKNYLFEVLKARIDDGCNVVGYTAWTLMDNWEWVQGYTVKFGLYSVDFEDSERPRTAKMSSYVYNNIITTRRIDMDYYPDWPPMEN